MTLQAQTAINTGDRMAVGASKQVGPIVDTLFYKEHITDTLDFLKRVYSKEQCAAIRIKRGEEYINRGGHRVRKIDVVHANLRAQQSRYRLTKHGQSREHGRDDVKRYFLSALKHKRTKCPICCHIFLTHLMHVDHITPLAKGGTNAHYNLRMTCARCNHLKSDKVYSDMLPFEI